MRALADRTDGEITSAALSRIEKGDRYPTLRTLEALARALNGAFTVTPDGTVLRLAL